MTSLGLSDDPVLAFDTKEEYSAESLKGVKSSGLKKDPSIPCFLTLFSKEVILVRA